MSLTSDEVNFLIYRYLQESGFTHSTFAFAHEAQLVKNDLKNVNVSPGALINLLQKGLLYAEAESSINEDGTEKETSARPFSLLQLHEADASKEAARKKQEKLRKKKKEIEMMDVDDKKELSNSQVLLLQGHASEVFNVRWHPLKDGCLISGAGDASSRIWTLPMGMVDAKTTVVDPIVLMHEDNAESKDVTAVQWSHDGEYIVTGTYNGLIRLWKSSTGELIATAKKHKGPVFAVAWNKNNSIILSCGMDKSVIAWTIPQLEVVNVFTNHSAPVLDVDWKDNDIFASCSTDKTICIIKLKSKEILRRCEGHLGEVNNVAWSPNGKYLASCSDDKTAKVWTIDQDHPIADFKGHLKEIYTLDWSPTGPGSKNPDIPLMLATASFDNTVRIWDITSSRCIKELKQHTQAIYSVSFSPSGKHIASGGFDGRVIVWNLEDGSISAMYRGTSGVFEIAWNHSGNKIAAAFSKSAVCVFDFHST